MFTGELRTPFPIIHDHLHACGVITYMRVAYPCTLAMYNDEAMPASSIIITMIPPWCVSQGHHGPGRSYRRAPASRSVKNQGQRVFDRKVSAVGPCRTGGPPTAAT
jgi:hypothetical protein